MTNLAAKMEISRGCEPALNRLFTRDDSARVRDYRSFNAVYPETRRLTANGGLEAVLLKNRAALGRFARMRLRSDDGAEDILQEVWIKVQSVDAGPIAEPLAYLYRMTENLILDRKRGEARRSARDFVWTEGRVDGTHEAASDAAPNAEQIVIARDYLARVNKRLDALPERTAAIFRAVRIDKCPQKEIALLYEISVSAVEKHLQRAFREVVAVKAELEGDKGPAPLPSVEGVGHDA